MDEADLFLDTNVLLHYQTLDAIKWRDHIDAKHIRLHITQSVLDEIATKKDMGETKQLRKRAARVTKRLLEYLESANPFPLREDELLVLHSDTPKMEDFPLLNPASRDDQFIASVLTSSKSNSSNCYVVTGDSSLTLRVKLKQWGLRHFPAPEKYRLDDEPDAAEREKKAMQDELAALKKAQPKLKLTFLDGENFLKIEPVIRDTETFVRQRMTKLRDENQPLAVLSPANFAMRAAMGTAEQIQKYNKSLERYFEQYESALRRTMAIHDRTVDIKLKIFNGGAVPADSVHVTLHFPDGLKLVKSEDFEAELPQPPKKPTKPGISDELLRGLHTPVLPHSFFPIPSAPVREAMTITKTNSYDVVWEHEKLRQNTFEPLAELSAIFDSQIRSFEIEFELRADNLTKVVPGKLHVVAP